MSSIFSYLKKLLEGEVRHLETTLALLKKKEQVLIKNDLSKLEEVVLKERDLFHAFREIEDSRKSVVELFAARQGLTEKVINLSRVAEVLGGAEGEELEKYRTKISRLIQSINWQNEKCAVLLRKSIELADYSIRLISGGAGKQKIYNRTGAFGAADAQKKMILDCKA